MKLSKLEIASDYEVRDWLIKVLELTPYQQDVLRDREIIRFSIFYFYKRKKQVKVSIIWRFTLIAYLIWVLLLTLFSVLKWVFTGEFGYSSAFIDKYLYNWKNKLNL